MYNNGDYYQKLLKYSLEVKCPSSIQIDLDLRRTFPNDDQVMDDKFQQSLRNILVCSQYQFLFRYLNVNII